MGTFARHVNWLGRTTAIAATVLLVVGASSADGLLRGAPVEAQDSENAGSQARTERVGGPTRYGTAAAAAQRAFPDGAETAVLARGDAFPDALAAASLAGVLEAPVLLANGNGVPGTVQKTLEALGVQRVFLLGGQEAMSGQVEQDLVNVDTTRVGSGDRYRTAGRLARTAAEIAGAEVSRTAFLASGTRYPDALAAGPVAYADQRPLLLTQRDELHPAARSALEDIGTERVVILGGKAAVGSDVASSLADLGLEVERIGGANRFETAIGLAEHGLDEAGLSAQASVLARGDGYADALVGGPYAGELGAPVMLSSDITTLESTTGQWLANHCEEVEEIHALGGPGAVGAGVLGAAARSAECEPPNPSDGSEPDGGAGDGSDVDEPGSEGAGDESTLDGSALPGWEVAHSDVGPSGCGASVDDLTPSGSVTSDHDGQVIEGLDINGTVRIAHNDVTVRNTRIRAGGADTYGVAYSPTWNSGLSGTKLECVEVDGQGSASIGVLLHGQQEVIKSYVHGYRVGAHWRGDDRWVNNLVDDLHYEEGSHNTSGSVRGQNVELLGNRFEDGNSSALALYPDSYPDVVIRNVDLVENFWQTPDAHFCVYFGGDGEYAQQSGDIRVIHNMWGQEHSDVCGWSGPYHGWHDRDGNEWSDNIYQNGEPVTG